MVNENNIDWLHNTVKVVLQKDGNTKNDFIMQIQMATKSNCSSPVWIGSICGISFREAAVLSFCGIKWFINKEQKSSAVRDELTSLLCGPWNIANMVTSLFVVLIRKNWDRLSDLLGAHKNSPTYPKPHFRSFYYLYCIVILFLSNFYSLLLVCHDHR